MDRFKFRAYIKYAKLLEDVDSFFIDNLKEKITLHFSDCHTKTMKLSDCILEQCTGLRDKNGKLIYEGDILKSRYSDVMRYEVVYRNAGLCLRVFAIDKPETMQFEIENIIWISNGSNTDLKTDKAVFEIKLGRRLK